MFAGLRSDPFYLAWNVGELKKLPNLLEHDQRAQHGRRARYPPRPRSREGLAVRRHRRDRPHLEAAHPPRPPVLRIDWVGRPEQTNMRLNNPAMSGIDDIRDLWNQQTPFAIPKAAAATVPAAPEGQLRHLGSARRQGRLDAGSARRQRECLPGRFPAVRRRQADHRRQPSRDREEHDRGRPYQTGGGRTVDANSIDILLTWLVNRDREFLQGGATGATKPGMKVFPYFATPNTELQTVAQSIEVAATPDEVWSLIGDFGGAWHPLNARVSVTGTGIGQLRTIETLDGREIVERLEAVDNVRRCFRYTNIAGMPVSHYTGTLEVKPNGSGSVVDWRVAIRGQPSNRPCREGPGVDVTQHRSRESQVPLRSRAVTAMVELDPPGPSATDGEIAAINLESARRSAWARFAHDPRLPGVAEAIVDHERLAAQFLGDLDALDRLDALASQFARVDDSSRAALVQAEVASTAHRFADARGHLARAARMGGPREAIERQTLAIDQACGVELDAVLAARRRIAAASGRLEDLVPLGAVLADLERFAEADVVYRQAFVRVRRRFAVPAGVGLLSARHAVGRARARAGPGSCRALVSTRNRLLAGLCEGAGAPGGDLREPGPNRRRGGAAPAGAVEPRSGGPLASRRRADRAREVRRGRDPARRRTVRLR